MRFQGREDGAGHPGAAGVREHVEPLDLGGVRVEDAQPAAAHGLPGRLVVGDEEHGRVGLRRRRPGFVVARAEAGVEFCLLGCAEIRAHRVGPGDLADVEPRIRLHGCLASPKGYADQR